MGPANVTIFSQKNNDTKPVNATTQNQENDDTELGNRTIESQKNNDMELGICDNTKLVNVIIYNQRI